MQTFTVHIANWHDDAPSLRLVREVVFIREQQVPVELEWDGLDATCLHVLARSSAGDAVGTARLLADGHIGRMAVLEDWRGRGVGSALLLRLLEEARRRGLQQAVLNAQIEAAGFYAKFGFRAEGETFMDAGIPHIKMVLLLH